MGRDTYFLTSAIPYVNAEPHVGTAYEMIACDFVARYRRLRGDGSTSSPAPTSTA